MKKIKIVIGIKLKIVKLAIGLITYLLEYNNIVLLLLSTLSSSSFDPEQRYIMNKLYCLLAKRNLELKVYVLSL